jgi:hypothetical protein
MTIGEGLLASLEELNAEPASVSLGFMAGKTERSGPAGTCKLLNGDDVNLWSRAPG